MKKLLVYLLLITCFEGFISASLAFCYKPKKASETIKINISGKNNLSVQNGAEDNGIDKENIFSLRYF